MSKMNKTLNQAGLQCGRIRKRGTEDYREHFSPKKQDKQVKQYEHKDIIQNII